MNDDERDENQSGVSLLEQLGRTYRPSKLSGDYLRRYSPILEPIREAVRNVIEIGVEGGRSLEMWRDYFPNAVIHGVDIDPQAKVYESDRIRIWISDSTSAEQVRRIIQEISGPIQLMIDDGSHHPFDQIATFRNLFPSLAKGGFYFVEDVGGTRGPLRLRAWRAFMELVEGLNYWPKSMAAYRAPSMAFDTSNYWINNVVGVSFFRYLVIVEKGSNPADNTYLDGSTAGNVASPRPALGIARLRELPWPWYRKKRHFVKKREVRPEGVIRLGLRFLLGRW